MREMKFRAWDKTESEWIDIKYLRFEFNDFWYLQGQDEHENEIDPPYFSGDEDFVLMQYTGLKDKNGVEIYEGDAISWEVDNGVATEYYSAIVRYSENTKRYKGTYQWIVIYTDGRGYDNLSGVYEDELLVCGNVYENPELSEASK